MTVHACGSCLSHRGQANSSHTLDVALCELQGFGTVQFDEGCYYVKLAVQLQLVDCPTCRVVIDYWLQEGTVDVEQETGVMRRLPRD